MSGLRPTEEKGTNPKDAYGIRKVPLEVVPPTSVLFQSQAMATGAEEYGPYNWRVSKVQAMVYLGAAYRHFIALLDGEDYDPKTGNHHGGHILACIGIYLDAMAYGNLIDNRPLRGPTGDLISALNEVPGEPPRTPEQRRFVLERFLNRQRALRGMIDLFQRSDSADSDGNDPD